MGDSRLRQAIQCDYWNDQNIDCRKKAAPIVGTCEWCFGEFCSAHRLPEDHDYPHMIAIRNDAFNKNAKRLEDGKTTRLEM
jgi:predicted nucleic acid binding AN1-type Zn finger protein